MKKALLLILTLALTMTALSESPLTVNGMDVSAGEINAYLLSVREAYAETAAYYESALGIDYWLLTYPNGQTVEQAVKADAFRGLVMLNLLYQEALAGGLTLSDAEKDALTQAVEMNLPSASEAGCNREELMKLYEKQILSEKQYSYLISYETIDEEAAAANVDKSRFVTYEADCLYVPAGLFGKDETEVIRETLGKLSEENGFSEEALPAGFYRTFVTLSEYLSSDETLLNAVRELAEGDISPVIETEYGLFILKLLSVSDGSAFYINAVEDAMRIAREDAYSEKYNGLYASAEYTLDPAFWDEITLR